MYVFLVKMLNVFNVVGYLLEVIAKNFLEHLSKEVVTKKFLASQLS